MSGHSKWANIKHKKGAADAARGKAFTKHAKLIEMAAREGGGGDPVMNTRLATAIENAKAENVPNANIERAIKKGTGELKGEITEAITYEAYGPGGTAFIIECLTDNRNRTISNVRSAIERHGGRWAESGSVMFQFDRKGVVSAEGTLTDALELQLIDAGAEDIQRHDGSFSVITAAAQFGSARDVLRAAGFIIQEAGLKYIAKQDMPVSDLETARKVMEFMNVIEEDDDVSEVHTNADISEEIANALEA